MDRAMAGGEDLWSDERKRPLILPIGMHFPGLCAKMPGGLCSAGGADIMIPAIIVGGHLAVAVADRPPVVNFEQTCREETTGEMRTNDKFEVCIADEKRARDQLAAQWSSFDPAARTRCARTSTSGHAASYLELLVCLELDQPRESLSRSRGDPWASAMRRRIQAKAGPDPLRPQAGLRRFRDPCSNP
jgi:hypothetical protein